MRHSYKNIIIFLLCISCWASWGEAIENIDELRFGIIATESRSNLKKGFDPLLKQLEKNLGVPIKSFFSPDYAGVIEALRFGKIHVAWFGNKSGMEAVDRANGEVFAEVTDHDGTSGYHSVIIVPKDSPYQTIDEIIQNGKDLIFGNGDPNSTSGYLMPSYHLWGPKGINPKKYFKRMRNASHEMNCISVATKQVDFATNNDESLRLFYKNHPDKTDTIRTIWTSPPIPSDPMVWHKDLSPEWKARIKAVFLAFGRYGPEADKEIKILSEVGSGWGVFMDSNNDQLIPIRELQMAKERVIIKNHPRLKENQKNEQLLEISKREENLKQYIKLKNYWNSTKVRNR
ncbi:MAG: phosphonate ABC transporter substrate-binding protein [Candidatus Poribacteria bacterium]|jgi:phosphonate transport system substrate-binding protein|nr:phosphonate ABC transporter substrate-binding protein [Candidatus Poribacteria bacterium]